MRRRRRYWVKVLTFLIVLCVFVCITSFAEVSYIVQFASVRTGARVKTDTSDGSKLSDGGYVWPRPPDAAVPPNSGRRFLGNSGLDEEQYDSLDTGNGTALRHDSSVTTVRPPCAAVTDPPVLATVHKCQPLDVAVVCAGATAVRQVATLIKSILFYRKNPLNFHFLVDTLAKHVLSNLFRTWNLPKVSVEFYDVDKLTPEVAWVPNKHYSGVFGLLKLTLVNALPQNLTKVIVLDTDVIFNVDIAELWSLWFHFNAKQSIGLVENHSDWYLGKLWKNLKVWPALGRGFNTGVILMHLGRLRSYHFPTVWHEIAEKQLGSLFSTSLADQDIINAVIKNDSGIVFELPCIWNLQLGDNSLSEDLCSSHLTDIKVFHWNSPRKQKSYRGRHVGYYRKLYLSFLEFDGNLLRRELYHCAGSAGNGSVVDLPEDQEFEDDECYEFRRHSYIQYRTHLYLLDFHYVEKSDDVTLIAQMSIDRLQMLEQLMQHWEGPASVTVYLSDVEQQQFLNYVQESSILMARRNVAYHVVYKEGVFYPINYLRNVALRQVVTPYVYLTDIDFLPMYGLYEQLRQAIAAQGSMINKALIVPAFETQRYRFDFPKSKTELLTMLDTNMLFIFRHDVWVKGHRATDYDRWPTATTPYTVSWTNDFEPYVVVNKDIPEYDTRFLGFGWNKVSQIMELDAIGYDFIVLPNAFMIHLPHAPSFDIAKYRSSHQYRKCLKLLKGQFIKELAKKYIRTRKVPNNNIGINNTSSNVVR